MANEVIQLVLAVLTVVLGAAAEELLPKDLGVGFPVLLASVPFAVSRRPWRAGLVFTVLAGAMEEAVSSLPPMSGVSFFLAVAFLVRYLGPSGALAALYYPGYQAWLSIWFVGIGGGVFGRILLSCPIGFLTVAAVGMALDFICRKAAVDEQG